jgi:cyclase
VHSGAGLKDIVALIGTFGIIGAAAGSLFVFKGIYRAVLNNYPSRAEKDVLIEQAQPELLKQCRSSQGAGVL